LNQSGQAYSVFKLLIAAIIAVAILYILISIIGGINIFGSDVQTVAKQIIQKQVDMPGQLDTSTAAVFKSGTNLAPSALVGNSGLTPEQICLHKGELVDNIAVTVTGSTLMQNGTTDLTVKISVMCHKADALQAAIDEVGLTTVDLDDVSAGSCGCDLTTTQKCCVVILRFA